MSEPIKEESGDKKEGYYESFHKNGKRHIYSCYHNGILDGFYSEYDEDGRLIINKEIDRGCVLSTETFRYRENDPNLLQFKHTIYHSDYFVKRSSLEEYKMNKEMILSDKYVEYRYVYRN